MRLPKFFVFIAILLLFVMQGCQTQNDTESSIINIHEEEITLITINNLSDGTQSECNSSQVISFVDAFNEAKKYDNTVGTTPTHRVDVIFSDNKTLAIWGYNQGFATMQFTGEDQQNITGEKLAQWFSENADN